MIRTEKSVVNQILKSLCDLSGGAAGTQVVQSQQP
jgi:hypothetical protein